MVNVILATTGAAFAPVDQHYLFQARQMQALSLAVHTPLVCFGIAFPSLVLFAEWRYLRTGDPLFRTLARRWSKVMLALFAVGVVTEFESEEKPHVAGDRRRLGSTGHSDPCGSFGCQKTRSTVRHSRERKLRLVVVATDASSGASSAHRGGNLHWRRGVGKGR